jgi:hypothetical protein
MLLLSPMMIRALRCSFCFAVTLLAGAGMVGAEEGKRAPNIILILADDVSADELSPYGGEIAMPNLQKLADDGVLFRNGPHRSAHLPAPWS